MLYLIGVGLSKKEISIKAIDVCRESEVFFERYTSRIGDDYVAFISQEAGKPLHELNRADLEEKVATIVQKAAGANVALLVGGDPLLATTHKILFIEAKKRRVPVKIIHASSIIPAAIGESGLDFYRFGAVCTIPKWSDSYKPVSFYETISKNFKNGFHSLVLLDYDQPGQSSMPLADAISNLESAENSYKEGIIKDNTMIFVMHNVAADDQKNSYIDVKTASATVLSAGPTMIIIPANLTDIEKEVIASIY